MANLIPGDALAIATIRGEAEAEPFEGQVAVANVIRNRMLKRHFSDGTIAGTVLAPYQFSLWNTTEKRRITMCLVPEDDNASLTARRAWEESAVRRVVAPDVLMYHAASMNPYPAWTRSDEFKLAVRIGRHLFYSKVK